MNTTVKIVFGIVLVCIVAATAYFLFARPAPTPASTQAASSSTAQMEDGLVASSTISGVRVDGNVISQVAPPPAGYVEYKNDTYGFSFFHLPDGKIKEYDEGQGAATIVLQNDQLVRGMQVFIVPYTDSAISEARFHMDIPSGVRTNVENAELDGVRAVTFNSTDEILGETREIWILKNGYLYEITTFSGVGNWFTPVIQSWRWL